MTDNPEMYNHTANTDEEYTPYYLRPETYIVPILFSIIFVVGVVGNGTLIVIFLRHKSMRNIPNTYIFSLALADLLVILTCVPFTSIIYTLESWPWGEFICKVSETCKDVSVGVSVFTLTALSAERYCAVVNPLKRLQTKPLTVISAAMIWVLAVLFAIPDAISSRVYKAKLDVNTTIEYCSPFPNITNGEIYMKTSIVMKCLVYYMIPLSIISCFYILMAIRLNRSAKDMPGEKSGTQGLAQSKARKHIAKMVLIFIFLFFICFLPQHVFFLWFHLNPNSLDDYNEFWHGLKIVGFCLSFLNSCVNPVALYCVSGVFRSHYNRYLCCRTSRWPKHNASASYRNTSFTSSKRQTQSSGMEFQSIYRKDTLTKQNVNDTEEYNYNSDKLDHKKIQEINDIRISIPQIL